MQLEIITNISLIYETKEYSSLIKEIYSFIEEEDTDFIGTIEGILDMLDSNINILSPFTVKNTLYFKKAEEFFIEIQDDIEEIDNDKYPHLSELLLTIGNKI